MYDLLPELKNMICMMLPCRDIIRFALCSKNCNKFVTDNDLFNKRKFYNFPRESGNCATHKIFKYKDKDDIWNSCAITYLEADRLLNKLIKDDIDLVRGDLLWVCDGQFSYGAYLFDGCNIINLEYNDIFITHRELIPSQFIIASKSVQIYYWIPIIRSNEIYSIRGTNFWFKIGEIRKQLLENIKHHGTKQIGEFKIKYENYIDVYSTNFTIANKLYNILVCYKVNEENKLEKLKETLSTKSKIMLDHYPCERDIFDVNTLKKDIFDQKIYLYNNIFFLVSDKARMW
jgi:hypothetical protein